MRSNRLGAALAFVAAIVAVLASAPAAHAARAPAGFLGMAPANVPSPEEFQRMARGGVGSVRIQISWPQVQQQPNGPYDWSLVDTQVAGAAGAGLPVLPFVFGTPAWAANCAGAPGELCLRVLPTKSAAGASGWSALLRAAVARYGPNGTFWTDTTDRFTPPFLPIRRWQIWNEENSAVFSPPRPSVGAFYQLLKLSKTALRGGDPGAQIVLGGLFGSPAKPGIVSSKFLDKLYAKKGAKNLFDAVAAHPYAPSLQKVTVQLESLRETMSANRDRKTPILITELGWGSSNPGSVPPAFGPLVKGLAGQAQILTNVFKLLAGQRRRYGLESVYWFSWRDSAPNTGGRCHLCESAGLFTDGFEPKPAWTAFTRAAGGTP